VCEHCCDGGRDDDCRVCRRRRRRAGELKQAGATDADAPRAADSSRTEARTMDGELLRAILNATSRKRGTGRVRSRTAIALAAKQGFRRSASVAYAVATRTSGVSR